jgi:CO/xanthine dehydrogenase Mo-binding subunit
MQIAMLFGNYRYKSRARSESGRPASRLAHRLEGGVTDERAAAPPGATQEEVSSVGGPVTMVVAETSEQAEAAAAPFIEE